MTSIIFRVAIKHDTFRNTEVFLSLLQENRPVLRSMKSPQGAENVNELSILPSFTKTFPKALYCEKRRRMQQLKIKFKVLGFGI